MLLDYQLGQTSIILRLKLRNSTSASGAGLTGLTSASTGLKISTIADNEASATTYTAAGSTIDTITTLGTFAAPTATHCRFKEVDATNHPGVYEIQLDNARFNVASSKSLLVSVNGATNLAECDVLVPLRSVNPYDGTRGGLSALPNAAAGTAGAVITSGTGTAQLSVSGGAVTVGTNNDKTGYSLSQTFPANFSALAITAGGAVTVGTNNDKTGYALTVTPPTSAQIATALWQDLTASSDFTTVGSIGKLLVTDIDATISSRLASASYTSPPTTGQIATAVMSDVTDTVGADVVSILSTVSTNLDAKVSTRSAPATAQTIDLTTAVPASNTAQTVGDCLNAARAQGFGKWILSGTTLTLYAADGVTAVRTFTLDSASSPTQRS